MTKPNQCVIGFTIPLDEKSFNKQNRNPDIEYVNINFLKRWWQYHQYIVNAYDTDIRDNLKRLKVNICYNMTFNDYKELFYSNNYKAIILFAHSRIKDSVHGIEFYDGFVKNSEIVDMLPYDYPGVIDLSACNSQILAKELKAKNPKYLIGSKFIDIIPTAWMSYYLLLFNYLDENEADYSEAYEKVSRFFITGKTDVLEKEKK
ncbi:MAG: hypothetical protein H7843_06145 [Nitrospirota bacterium]